MCLHCHSSHQVSDVKCKCRRKEEKIQDNTLIENITENRMPDINGLNLTECKYLSERLEDMNENLIDNTHKIKITGSCSGMVVGSYEAKTKIHYLINGGSFGHIYLGKCMSTQKTVAVKVEQQGTGSEKILQEGNIYYKLQGGPGIPCVYWYGMHGSEYNFLVMELLGPSLAHLFHQCDEQFSVPTVLKIAVKLLNVIRFVHSQDILHRDISPDNFVIGKLQSSNENEIFLIDFGLAKKCNSAGQLVLPGKGRYSFQLSRPMVGTPRFASLGVHQGANESRRDDLESLAYIFIYFLKGSLPWQGSNTSSESLRFTEIAECKSRISASELCSDLPSEFATFLNYTRSLKPSDIPDYDGLVNLFKTAAQKRNIDLEKVIFDWSNK